jgi:hypothetical protein
MNQDKNHQLGGDAYAVSWHNGGVSYYNSMESAQADIATDPDGPNDRAFKITWEEVVT